VIAAAGRLQARGLRVPAFAALVVAVAATSVLAAVELGLRPFWTDETVSVEAARLPFHSLVDYLAHVEVNMALYTVALHVWLLAGHGEAYARVPSVLFAVATLPVLYALGRRLFDSTTAAVAVLLLATNVVFVAHAREARGYSLAVLLVTASSLFLVRAVQESSRRDWVLYALAAALAVYAHLLAVLVVPAQLVSLAALGRAAPRRRAAVALGGLVLLLVPAAVAVAAGHQSAQIDWLPAPGLRKLPGLALWLAGNRVLAVLFVLAALAALAATRLDAPADRFRSTLLGLWLCAPPLAAFVLSAAKPLYLYRYFLPSLPAFALLAAAGILRLRRGLLVVPLALAAATVSTVSVARCLPDCGIRHDDWRAAAADVRPLVRPGDAILFDPGDVATPFVHYFGARGGLVLLHPRRWGLAGGPADGAGSLSEAVERARSYRRVWLVTWWLPDGGVPGELARTFRLARSRDFAGNVRVRLYVRAG